MPPLGLPRISAHLPAISLRCPCVSFSVSSPLIPQPTAHRYRNTDCPRPRPHARPRAFAQTAYGGVYVADTGNHCIRHVMLDANGAAARV